VTYRPDIDGLRAIAVLAVVAFHAFPGAAPGGFVGVDVFFVISGYLISGIIIAGLREHRFSFTEFYARRIRRIFPALVIVLFACWLCGWFVLFADDYRQLSAHITGGVAFASNFVLWNEAGYFDDAADTKPLLHLWSLGIEEQFYLVWPLLLLVAWRRGVNLLWFTVTLLVASFLYNVWRIRIDVVGTFYSPVTRFWELLVGGTLACLAAAPSQVAANFRQAGAAIGLVLIATAIAVLDSSRLFPGLWAVLPTAGAALILAAGPGTWVNRALLSHPVLVWIGLVSYPLYLWHWPLLSFARIIAGETPSPSVRIAAVAASIVLAWLTYQLVERPVRHGRKAPLVVPVLCTLMAAVLVTAEVTRRTGGLFERTVNRSDRAHFLQYYDRMHKQGLAEAYRQECDFMDWPTGRVRESIAASCTQAGDRRTVLLWGDSYAQALSLGIRTLLPGGTRLAQVTTSLCRPSFDDIDAHVPDGRCRRSNQFAAATISSLRPDVVILAQMSGHERTDWESIAAKAVALGAKQVVLVGPVPVWRPSLPEVITSQYWGRDYSRVGYGLDPVMFETDQRLLQGAQGMSGVTYVSTISRLCNDEGCLAVVPGTDELMALDAGHLTPLASIYVGENVLRPYLLPR